jgi:L-ascorbate metabolism protein UlaG (beta-lactamase superfamily)
MCSVARYASNVRPDDIGWTPEALGRRGGPGDVRVRWLGAAGFALEHAGHTVLFDPYVTRASLARCLTAPLEPDLRAIERVLPRADAIVVGHTHFDHAMDVPAIARRTGGLVLGSRSAAVLCRAAGVPEDQIEVVEPAAGSEPVERAVGPFELRFVPSAHSRLLLGRVPLPGEIADCDHVPLRAGAYRCGAVFSVEVRVAGRTIVHLGSAEVAEGYPAAKNVDLLLLCVAGWTSSHDLPERVARRFAPGAVLLSHWDDFLLPLSRPARPLPAVRLPALVERLTRAQPSMAVGTLPLKGDVWA